MTTLPLSPISPAKLSSLQAQGPDALALVVDATAQVRSTYLARWQDLDQTAHHLATLRNLTPAQLRALEQAQGMPWLTTIPSRTADVLMRAGYLERLAALPHPIFGDPSPGERGTLICNPFWDRITSETLGVLNMAQVLEPLGVDVVVDPSARTYPDLHGSLATTYNCHAGLLVLPDPTDGWSPIGTEVETPAELLDGSDLTLYGPILTVTPGRSLQQPKARLATSRRYEITHAERLIEVEL